MSSLDSLLRRSVRRVMYHPFSEPRFAGPWPFARARRGIFHTANNVTPSVMLLSQKALLPSPRRLNLYEDRRLFHPEGELRPARSLVEARPRIVDRVMAGDPREYYSPKTGELLYTTAAYRPDVVTPGMLGFRNPWKVFICLKRKMRKEVLHAFNKTGKTGFRKPKWTQFSYVRCY